MSAFDNSQFTVLVTSLIDQASRPGAASPTSLSLSNCPARPASPSPPSRWSDADLGRVDRAADVVLSYVGIWGYPERTLNDCRLLAAGVVRALFSPSALSNRQPP